MIRPRISARLSRRLVGVMCVGTLAVAMRITAQEMSVPVDIQWSLVSKVLTFDRNFVARHPSKIVVGILYQSRYRLSVDVKNELKNAIEHKDESEQLGADVDVVAIDVGRMSDLGASMADAGVAVAYVAPLRGVDVGDVAATCRDRKVISVTGVPEYVEQGICVGIATRGGHPNIVIGLTAAKSSGADFSSQLLKIATVLP